MHDDEVISGYHHHQTANNVQSSRRTSLMEPFLNLQKSPAVARRYFLHVIIISAILKSIDLFFWITSFILAYQYYYVHKRKDYGNLTVLFATVPPFVFTAISIARAIHNINKSIRLESENDSKKSNLGQVIIFVLLPQLGAYYKLMEILRATANHSSTQNSFKTQHFHFIIHLKDEATLLNIASDFIQSIFQFILQGYLLFTHKVQENALVNLQVISMVSSLLCLASAAAASEQKSLVVIEWVAIISAFFWKLFSLASRMLCLVLLISVSISYFFLFCILHALLFCGIVTVKSKITSSRCQSLVLSPLVGTVYIFDDINISYGKSFPNHLLYYTVTFLEGALIVFLWISNSRQMIWYSYWMAVAVYSSFFLGIVFFRLFYEYHHKHTVCVPIFDCFFGYPNYESDNIEDMRSQRRT